MKASEIVSRQIKIQTEHDLALSQLNNDVSALNYTINCKSHEIHFMINKLENPYFPIDPKKLQTWSYNIKVTKSDYGTVRNRDWMDLPKNVKRFIKVFYKIGDQWLLDGLDLNWPEQMKTERERIVRLTEWEETLNLENL